MRTHPISIAQKSDVVKIRYFQKEAPAVRINVPRKGLPDPSSMGRNWAAKSSRCSPARGRLR